MVARKKDGDGPSSADVLSIASVNQIEKNNNNNNKKKQKEKKVYQ